MIASLAKSFLGAGSAYAVLVVLSYASRKYRGGKG